LVIAVLYTPPQVRVHSMQTAKSPMESELVHTDYVKSMCTLHELCRVCAESTQKLH
jgi:hypothetical protein